MDCGTLKPVKNDGNKTLKWAGTIALGHRLNGSLLFHVNPRSVSKVDPKTGKAPAIPEGVPNFIVEYLHKTGSNVRPMGFAWLKHSEEAGDFLSITLDDPDWRSPLNLAAFNNGDGLTVVWTRPRGQRAAQVADDEIPY